MPGCDLDRTGLWARRRSGLGDPTGARGRGRESVRSWPCSVVRGRAGGLAGPARMEGRVEVVVK